MSKLIKFVETLTITQGDGAGEPIRLLPFQKKLLRAVERGFNGDLSEIYFSAARGCGKTTVCAAIAVAALIYLRVPRGQIVIVAASFDQGLILFNHCLAFLRELGYDLAPDKKNPLRILNNPAQASIELRETGTMIKVISSDPRRAHGLAAFLILGDEPAQWPDPETMASVLRTTRGKIPGSVMILLGTRPENREHFFEKGLTAKAKGRYAQKHAAPDDADPFSENAWKAANPGWRVFPHLRKTIRGESAAAKIDSSLLPSYKALRLNQGVSDVVRSHLVEPETWIAAEAELEPGGWTIWGIDLGQTAAMSAIAIVHESGRLETMAAFPADPDIRERERSDGAVGLYSKMLDEGSLILLGGKTVPVDQLLSVAIERYGMPEVILADRWRDGELVDGMNATGIYCELILRGMGYKDGGEDVRLFRQGILNHKVRPVKSLLLRSAMSGARVTADPAGNEKLAKNTIGGRRLRCRDDAAAAAILATAQYVRQGHDNDMGHSDLPFLIVPGALEA